MLHGETSFAPIVPEFSSARPLLAALAMAALDATSVDKACGETAERTTSPQRVFGRLDLLATAVVTVARPFSFRTRSAPALCICAGYDILGQETDPQVERSEPSGSLHHARSIGEEPQLLVCATIGSATTFTDPAGVGLYSTAARGVAQATTATAALCALEPAFDNDNEDEESPQGLVS